jgi:metal-responsive CopG/Arc/MetJ family transcriptional regulator
MSSTVPEGNRRIYIDIPADLADKLDLILTVVGFEDMSQLARHAIESSLRSGQLASLLRLSRELIEEKRRCAYEGSDSGLNPYR